MAPVLIGVKSRMNSDCNYRQVTCDEMISDPRLQLTIFSIKASKRKIMNLYDNKDITSFLNHDNGRTGVNTNEERIKTCRHAIIKQCHAVLGRNSTVQGMVKFQDENHPTSTDAWHNKPDDNTRDQRLILSAPLPFPPRRILHRW